MNTEIKDMAETARERGNIYGFLSLIYRTEVTKDLLRRIKDTEMLTVLIKTEAGFADDFLSRSDSRLIEDLAVEYARLFLGPGKHIPPYESVHHERDDGDWGRLWGKDTVLVKKFIESAGLEYKSEFTGLPDHISVELEFMRETAKREARAWKENNLDGAVYCLKMEKKFIDEHLAMWITVFCDKVIANAEMSFYREIARLTKSFIELEKEEINKYLKDAERDRRKTCSD